MSDHTVLVIKNDAIVRGLVHDLLQEVRRHFVITRQCRKVLTRNEVSLLKADEWSTNWVPPPSDETKEAIFRYEAAEVLGLLCEPRSTTDAIACGCRIKGEHHLAHRCSPSTLRGKYCDRSLVARIVTSPSGVSLLQGENGTPPMYPPNVVHCASNERELATHMAVFFPDAK